MSAKYWLEPVALAKNWGFPAPELREIEHKIVMERNSMVEKWHEYFRSRA